MLAPERGKEDAFFDIKHRNTPALQRFPARDSSILATHATYLSRLLQRLSNDLRARRRVDFTAPVGAVWQS